VGLTVLDAGVIVAVLDASDMHHRAAIEALRAIQADGDSLLLPTSAFAECLVWPFRAGDWAVAAAEALIDALPVTVVAADRSIGRAAARLRAEHGNALRLPDALVVATALGSRASRILTTNRGWPVLEVPVQVVGEPLQDDAPRRPARRSRHEGEHAGG